MAMEVYVLEDAELAERLKRNGLPVFQTSHVKGGWFAVPATGKAERVLRELGVCLARSSVVCI